MPAVSGSSDRHPKTDRRSTLLEALIEQLRRLVVESFPPQPLDVLSHAYADVCLTTQTLRCSMPDSTARPHKPHLEATYIPSRGGLRLSVGNSSGGRVVLPLPLPTAHNHHYVSGVSGRFAQELLVESVQLKLATDWSADGKFLVHLSLDPETDANLWVLPITGDRKPRVRKVESRRLPLA